MMNEYKITINCDLGECLTPNLDSQIMPLIDMANIACGGHMGDKKSMVSSIKLAKQHGVIIGAHPSYVDRPNFGRISHSLSPDKLLLVLNEQVAYFQKLCIKHGTKLQYIKPHGALYHDAAANKSILSVLCQLIQATDPSLFLVVPASLNTDDFKGINFVYEAFADRAYKGNEIIARSEKNAVFTDPQQIINQYKRFLSNPPFLFNTICFHGDNPPSVQALTALKSH